MGGIVGYTTKLASIRQCSNHAIISGECSGQILSSIGGIVGISNSTIDKCYNTGNISSISLRIASCGGIVGNNNINPDNFTISNCYNIGNIYAEVSNHNSSRAGGIIGTCGNGVTIICNNCYNVGKVETIGNTNYRGGILGSQEAIFNCTNNYWLSTCNCNYGIGKSNSNIGAESKTLTELKLFAETLGNAFLNDNNNINGGYPILSWQVEE